MASISSGSSGKGPFWDVRWREAGRERRRRFYRSEFRKAAVNEFLELVRAVERLGPEARRGAVTVGAFVDDTWWPMTRDRVRPNTRARFDVIRRNYLPAGLRSRAISDVRRGELIKLVADVVNSGKVESAKTLRTVLRLIWKDALDWELVDSNIAAGLPVRVPDRDVDDVAVDRESVLSVGDVRRIAARIDPHRPSGTEDDPQFRRLIFGLPPDLDDALRRRAEEEDRPLAWLVRRALTDYLGEDLQAAS